MIEPARLQTQFHKGIYPPYKTSSTVLTIQWLMITDTHLQLSFGVSMCLQQLRIPQVPQGLQGLRTPGKPVCHFDPAGCSILQLCFHKFTGAEVGWAQSKLRQSRFSISNLNYRVKATVYNMVFFFSKWIINHMPPVYVTFFTCSLHLYISVSG